MSNIYVNNYDNQASVWLAKDSSRNKRQLIWTWDGPVDTSNNITLNNICYIDFKLSHYKAHKGNRRAIYPNNIITAPHWFFSDMTMNDFDMFIKVDSDPNCLANVEMLVKTEYGETYRYRTLEPVDRDFNIEVDYVDEACQKAKLNLMTYYGNPCQYFDNAMFAFVEAPDYFHAPEEPVQAKKTSVIELKLNTKWYYGSSINLRFTDNDTFTPLNSDSWRY